MRTIRIISRKYDGRPRDDYEALLYAEDDERLVVYAPVGTLSYDRRAQVWAAAADGLLEIYFKHRWYNVWHICEQNSNTNQIYSNLATPAVTTGLGIEWVDLDLDYRVHLDGRLERLDEAEYCAHIISMGYPADVQARVQAACAEIEALYEQRADPFNHPEQVALYRQIQAAVMASQAAQGAQRRESMPLQISLTTADEVDAEVLAWLQRAYEQNC